MSKQRTVLGVILIVALVAPGMTLAQPAAPQAAPAPEAQAGSILFVENAGQWPDAARFQVWGSPAGVGTTWLAEDAIWISMVTSSQAADSVALSEEPANLSPATALATGIALKLTFPGANPQPTLEPSTAVDTKVNYFLGNDPSQWRPGVPVWSTMRYHDLYPGVDLVLGDGASGALPWRLEAQPGSESSAVRLRVDGADSLALDGRLLRISTSAGEIALPLPAADFSYQVEAPTTDGRLISFETAPGKDAGQQDLDISQHAPANNPAELMVGTFLGGDYDEWTYAIAVDAVGRATVTGETISSDFPTTPGAFDPTFNGGYQKSDAFVTRLSADGRSLVYSTFLGGSENDLGYALALDAAGRVTVTGSTRSSNFPTTSGAFDRTFGGGTCGTPPYTYPCSDAFVIRLNAAGSALDYASFLGGSDYDGGSGLALDSAGRATVTGYTRSSTFPTTPGAFDRTFGGGTCGTPPNTYLCYDAFVVRLNAAGSALDYATFLGGSDYDLGYAVALDSAGRASVTGYTRSTTFPTTPVRPTGHSAAARAERLPVPTPAPTPLSCNLTPPAAFLIMPPS